MYQRNSIFIWNKQEVELSILCCNEDIHKHSWASDHFHTCFQSLWHHQQTGTNEIDISQAWSALNIIVFCSFICARCGTWSIWSNSFEYIYGRRIFCSKESNSFLLDQYGLILKMEDGINSILRDENNVFSYCSPHCKDSFRYEKSVQSLSSYTKWKTENVDPS